jgi:hypothetical protein
MKKVWAWLKWWWAGMPKAPTCSDPQLTKAEWMAMDAQIMRAARIRLRGWGDLQQQFPNYLPRYYGGRE